MKIAIVGCGQIADAHIQEANRIAGTEVAAVCDLNIHMAKQAAMRYEIPGIYTDINTMLEEVNPEVVHITTPPKGHLPLAKIALHHGSHVYVEKPFTVNLAEAKELVDTANRAERLVCLGHSCTTDSAFRRVKKLYRQEELGDIVHIDVVMAYNLAGPFGALFMRDPTHWIHSLPGGILQNNISHPLTLIMEFLKDEKPQIHARGFRWRKEKYGDIRDHFYDESRVMIAGNEITAHILFSSRVCPRQLCASIYGTKRQVIVNLDSRTMQLIEDASMPGPFAKVQLARRNAKQAKREYRMNLVDLLRARLHLFDGMNELFRQFYMAIEGKGEMPVPMSEALRATAIMDEIIRQCNENDSEVESWSWSQGDLVSLAGDLSKN